MTLKRVVSTLIITVFILVLCGCKNQAGETANTSNNLEVEELQETDSLLEADEEQPSTIKLIGEGDYLVSGWDEADLILMISNQSKYGSINGIAGIMDIRVGVEDEILVDDIFGGDDSHNLTYYFFEFEDGWYTLDFESGSGATKSRAVLIDDTPQWVSASYGDEDNLPEFMLQYSNEPFPY